MQKLIAFYCTYDLDEELQYVTYFTCIWAWCGLDVKMTYKMKHTMFWINDTTMVYALLYYNM